MRSSRAHTLPARLRDYSLVESNGEPRQSDSWPSRKRGRPSVMNMRELKNAFEEDAMANEEPVKAVDLADALFPDHSEVQLPSESDRLKLMRRSPPPSPTEEVETLALLQALVAEEEQALSAPSSRAESSGKGDAHSEADSDEALADDIFSMMVSDDPTATVTTPSWTMAFEEMETPFELLAPEMLLDQPLVHDSSFSDTASSASFSSSDTTPTFDMGLAPPLPSGKTALPSKTARVGTAPLCAVAGDKNGRNVAERKEWSAAEDALIRSSVEAHGCKWRIIAAELPGRSDDAVRNRWNRLKEAQNAMGESGAEGGACAAKSSARPPRGSVHADSSDKPERVSWTRQEDETIVRSVNEFGNKWGKIAARLPGRTEHAIRNRFSRLQSLASEQAAAPTFIPLRSAVAAC